MAVEQKDARSDKQEHCCIRDIRHNHWRHNKSVYLDESSVAKPAPPASYAKPRPASAKRKAEHHQTDSFLLQQTRPVARQHEPTSIRPSSHRGWAAEWAGESIICRDLSPREQEPYQIALHIDNSNRYRLPPSPNLQHTYINDLTPPSQPVCQNCTTSTTPLWRRDEAGSVLCNACGLFLKLHGRPRPISLKTDVIKSRNRVKTSQTPRKHDRNGNPTDLSPHTHSQPGPGFPAAHPDVAHAGHAGAAPPYVPHNLPPAPQMGSGAQQGHDRIASPGASLSRSGTPSQQHAQHHQNPNIAPQHIFDTVSMPADSFASPGPHHLEAPQSYDAVVAQNNALRTRVSELEVINDLFRGRVSELEASEQEARREVEALRKELESVKRGDASAEIVAEQRPQQEQEQEQEQQNHHQHQSEEQDHEHKPDEQERSPKRARTEDRAESGEAGFAEFTRSEESQENAEGHAEQ